MTYVISFTSEAKKTLTKVKKSNANLWKKVERVIHEMADNPKTGTGHPEPLKGGQSITYSRRISAHDRIIYDVYDDRLVVLVIKLEGHYDDKCSLFFYLTRPLLLGEVPPPS